MPIGAFTGQFDLPLLLVILFVLFFFCLVYYLRQEDKREGYPLVSHRRDRTNGRVEVVGFPALPTPKVFHLPHGRPDVFAPRREEIPPIDARNVGNPTGMPIEPNGDPLLSGTGPASWIAKVDEPDLSHDGEPVFIPMNDNPDYRVLKGDPDPRGFAVLGLDKVRAGRVADIWIDRSEHFAKFLEIELDDELRADGTGTGAADVAGVVVIDAVVETEAGPVEITEIDVVSRPAEDAAQDRAGGSSRVLLPLEFASVDGRRRTVRTAAITAAQFARVPRQKDAGVITAREENRIRGYYGGGSLWAIPDRAEPLL